MTDIHSAIPVSVLSIVLMAASATASASDLITVAVISGQVALIDGEKMPVALTSGASEKSLPTWSPSGDRIAYIEATDTDKVAAGRLIVIRADGGVIMRALVQPVRPDTYYLDMRWIARVEWIGRDRIAVSGSLNPTTGVFDVFDSRNGHFISEYTSDGVRAAFSPTGYHVATVDGAPHFHSPDQTFPMLVVDGSEVFGREGTELQFVSDPVWSGDSGSVAIVAKTGDTNEGRLIVWNKRDGVKERSIGKVSYSSLPVWTGSSVKVATAPLFSGKPGTTAVDEAIGQAPSDAVAFQRQAVAKAKNAGGIMPDFFCRTCPIANEPRVNDLDKE